MPLIIQVVSHWMCPCLSTTSIHPHLKYFYQSFLEKLFCLNGERGREKYEGAREELKGEVLQIMSS